MLEQSLPSHASLSVAAQPLSSLNRLPQPSPVRLVLTAEQVQDRTKHLSPTAPDVPLPLLPPY